MSGTQTQISGSSPVKRAPGTLPQLPNPNQQRFCGNDTAWASAAYTLPPYLSQGLPTSSFASLLPSDYLLFQRHWIISLNTSLEDCVLNMIIGVWIISRNTHWLWLRLTKVVCSVTRISATVQPSLPTTICLGTQGRNNSPCISLSRSKLWKPLSS